MRSDPGPGLHFIGLLGEERARVVVEGCGRKRWVGCRCRRDTWERANAGASQGRRRVEQEDGGGRFGGAGGLNANAVGSDDGGYVGAVGRREEKERKDGWDELLCVAKSWRKMDNIHRRHRRHRPSGAWSNRASDLANTLRPVVVRRLSLASGASRTSTCWPLPSQRARGARVRTLELVHRSGVSSEQPTTRRCFYCRRKCLSARACPDATPL